MRYENDGSPTGYIDHMAEGSALVPATLQKPGNLALLGTFLNQVQAAEDAAWQLFTLRFLSVATGDALDRWGRMVGEPRNADGDDFYRVRITVRIAVNRSRGNFADLRKIALLAFGHSEFVIWAGRKTVAIHVFAPFATLATRAMVLRWFALAKVACDGFRLVRSAGSPLRMVSVTATTIPSKVMEFSGNPGSGGRLMGEV